MGIIEWNIGEEKRNNVLRPILYVAQLLHNTLPNMASRCISCIGVHSRAGRLCTLTHTHTHTPHILHARVLKRIFVTTLFKLRVTM